MVLLPFSGGSDTLAGIALLIVGLATAADLFSVFVGPPKTP